jgi:hypothetical protein
MVAETGPVAPLDETPLPAAAEQAAGPILAVVPVLDEPPAEAIEAIAAAAPAPAEEAGRTDLATRLVRAEQEAEFVRTDLTRQITNLSLKLDAAYQKADASQKEIARLQTDNAQMKAESLLMKEDQEVYKQMGTGQQDAVQKLMDRADQSQSRAEAAARQTQVYLFIMLLTLLIAVGAIGFAILVILQTVR